MVLFSCVPPVVIFRALLNLVRIIGVQSFKGSLRRSCVLTSTLGEGDILLDQFCGGYIDPSTLETVGFKTLSGENASATKGYICPLGQICQVYRFLLSPTHSSDLFPAGVCEPEGEYSKFRCDMVCSPTGCYYCHCKRGEEYLTIRYCAYTHVRIVDDQWTPLMYAMIDSEFFVSCFFFIICVVVLNFWLINLFVAVITNTFAAIRSETKKSAFGAAP